MLNETFIQNDSFLILPLIQNESVDVIHTDPPYGQDMGYGRSKAGVRERRTIVGDDTFLDILPFVCKEFYRILKPDSFCVIWCQWRTYSAFEKCLKDAGFEIDTVGIWDKGIQGTGDGFCETYEQWIIARKGKARANRMAKNVINFARLNGSRPSHPHAKPPYVIKRILKNITKPNDTVYDFFAGTGSTAISCLELGNLGYYCVEIVKEYVDEALHKINAYHAMLDIEFR